MEFSASECLWSIYLVTVLILIMLLKLCAGIFSIPVMPLLLPSWTDAVMLRCNHHLLFFLVIYKRNKWHVCGSPLSKSSVLSHINVIRTNEHMHVACVQIFALVLFCHHFWYIMKTERARNWEFINNLMHVLAQWYYITVKKHFSLILIFI